MNKKNIVWISSYPKSGNTWFRVFLCNILAKSETPVSINELKKIPNASNRALIDKYIGVHSSDLTNEEINNCRPEVYRKWSRETKNTLYLKVHDAWHLNSKGNPLFPPDITKGVIYIVRHPLDIAVSFSYHNSSDLSTTIDMLNDSESGLCSKPRVLFNQVSQRLSGWSDHINSWIDKSNLSIHIIRYEDMINKPEVTFRYALNYLGIEHTESDLIKAIHFSSFEKMVEQENKNGFKEKPINTKQFFREGKENAWMQYDIEDRLIRKAYIKNQLMMNHFEYSTYFDIKS